MDIWGVGFKTADRIAQAFGIAPDHPERVMAGLLYKLRAICDDGHCWVERPTLVEATTEELSIASDLVSRLDQLWASNRIVIESGKVAKSRCVEKYLAWARIEVIDAACMRRDPWFH